MALRREGAPEASQLRGALARCAAAADESGQARVLAVSMPLGDCDPLAAFAGFGEGERFFWEQAARGLALAARGAVLEVEADPGVEAGQATAAVGARIRAVAARVDAVGPATPLFVGGFSFDGRAPGPGAWEAFPAGRMVLPELGVRRHAGETRATVCIGVSAGEDLEGLFETLAARLQDLEELVDAAVKVEEVPRAPSDGSPQAGAEYRVVADRSHATFYAQVESALDAIRAGDLEKVVLARSLEVVHPGRFGEVSFLDELRGLYPHCTVFARGRGRDLLVAASPELLVSLADETVEACALAGSSARGRSPEEDMDLAAALRESKKEQAEHEIVARSLRSHLSEWVDELEGPEAPELMRLLGIQHLATPLRGRLRASRRDAGVLDLVACLHPSPAVGGLPRAQAQAWIDRREGMERGWYAGPVGWMDARGDGEFWLALRSALIRNGPRQGASGTSSAKLFAGAGIVQGSSPEAELAETRIKLRALLAPLTEI